jgi:uncharacterized protein
VSIQPIVGQASQPLETSACWALLRSAEVGRLAVSIAGHLDIFPVNFVVDHGTVVFRTGEGAKLAAALAGPEVAFEADARDPDTGEAWSVVLKGRAEEIDGLHDALDAMTLPLAPWHAGSKNHFVRVVPGEISGRHFPKLDPAAWRTGLTEARHSSVE